MTCLSNRPEIGNIIFLSMHSGTQYQGKIISWNFEDYNLKWILIEDIDNKKIQIRLDHIEFFYVLRKDDSETIKQDVSNITTDHVERVKTLVELHKERKIIENSSIKDTLSKTELNKPQNHYVMPSFKKHF